MDGWKRRDVLIGMGGGFLLVELPAAAVAKKGKPKKEEAEVAPAEDLMREHGVLRRVISSTTMQRAGSKRARRLRWMRSRRARASCAR